MAVVHAIETDRTLFTFIVTFISERTNEVTGVGARKSRVAAIITPSDHLKSIRERLDLLGLSIGRRTGVELIVSVQKRSATAACLCLRGLMDDFTYALKGGFSGTTVTVPSSAMK